jgi:hypothetical protein
MIREKLLKIGLISVLCALGACSEGMSFSFHQRPPTQPTTQLLPTGNGGKLECWGTTTPNCLVRLPHNACVPPTK